MSKITESIYLLYFCVDGKVFRAGVRVKVDVIRYCGGREEDRGKVK
jgi:hypothetical protein